MSKGNNILLSTDPKGVFKEGFVSGTPKPGTVMQIKEGTEPVGGRHTWEVFDQFGDGIASLIAVLLPDRIQGKIATDAYVTGDRCYLYCPAAGEELNMLLANISGTSDAFAIGDRLMVDDTTGKLVANSSGASVPFVVMETVAGITADTLVWCMYTGH